MTPTVDFAAAPAPIGAERAHSQLMAKSPALWMLTLGLFLAAFAALMFFEGTLYVPSSDEGLNLEGAERLLDGQRPYVDFFGHASPGGYLYQALVLKVLGRSMWSSRVLVMAYQSLQIALLFWLVATYASRIAAVCATFIYTLIETADPVQLTAHHRWDSSTLGLLSIVMALAGKGRAWWWWSLAGLAGIASVIATPTAGLMLASTVVWLLLTKQKKELLAFAGAAVAGFGAVGLWMASAGLLHDGRFGGYLGFLEFMKANYTQANHTVYGFVQGGWMGLFQDAGFGDLLVRIPIVLCLALPVLTPLIALAAWTSMAWRGGLNVPVSQSTAWYLAGCQLAMILYPFPRADLSHLAYTSAFACALSAIWIARKLPRQVSFGLALFLMFWSLGFLYRPVTTYMNTVRMQTPAGSALVARLHEPEVKALMEHVQKGETLFVYPFMPNLGYLMQARNPTSFMFMQPAMMNAEQELALVDDLKRTHPQWIVWFPWTEKQFVTIFPGAEGMPYNFPEAERWIEANYTLRVHLKEVNFHLFEYTGEPKRP